MGPGTKMGFLPSYKAETSCCEACAANLTPRPRYGLKKVAGRAEGSDSSFRKTSENAKTMKTMYVSVA